MNTLFKGYRIVMLAIDAALGLLKRAIPFKWVTKDLLLGLFVFFPIALISLYFSPRPAAAAEYAIGLSHSVDTAQIKPLIVERELALAPGDTLTFYDVPDGKKLTSVTIPNDPAKARPERKVEFIAPAMAILNRYFATAPPAGGENLNASPFFDAMGPTLMEHGVGSLLLIGSPWFTAPGSLDKKDYVGAFPSDGLILADRSKSPFGTQGKHDLGGITIHYCYTTDGANGFINPEHKERVERAWSLLIAQRGGVLGSFTDDPKSCFDNFSAEKPPEPHHFAIDPKDATMQYMYRAQDVAPRIMNAQPVKTGDSSGSWTPDAMRAEGARFDRPARSTPPSTRTGAAWIGIQWKDPIDLDLYVKCDPTSSFLFFAHQRSPEGRHNFDYRGGTGTEFETVNLTSACPDIAKAQVFVNFFSGSVRASPKGVVAIEFDGGLYKASFEMPAHEGNRGAGGNEAGTMGAPYWVKIDLASVLHLNGSVAAVRPRTRSTK
jgi:hypothetical protein